jgi:hypothetical protein
MTDEQAPTIEPDHVTTEEGQPDPRPPLTAEMVASVLDRLAETYRKPYGPMSRSKRHRRRLAFAERARLRGIEQLAQTWVSDAVQETTPFSNTEQAEALNTDDVHATEPVHEAVNT